MDASASELTLWQGSEFQWPWSSGDDIDWNIVKAQYNVHKSECFKLKGDYEKSLEQAALVILKDEAHNDELWEWVLQDDRTERALTLSDGRIVQKAGPIHRKDDGTDGMGSTMYVPYKKLFEWTLTTVEFNVLMLFLMSAILWIVLLLTPAAQSLTRQRINLRLLPPQA